MKFTKEKIAEINTFQIAEKIQRITEKSFKEKEESALNIDLVNYNKSKMLADKLKFYDRVLYSKKEVDFGSITSLLHYDEEYGICNIGRQLEKNFNFLISDIAVGWAIAEKGVCPSSLNYSFSTEKAPVEFLNSEIYLKQNGVNVFNLDMMHSIFNGNKIYQSLSNLALIQELNIFNLEFRMPKIKTPTISEGKSLYVAVFMKGIEVTPKIERDCR